MLITAIAVFMKMACSTDTPCQYKYWLHPIHKRKIKNGGSNVRDQPSRPHDKH